MGYSHGGPRTMVFRVELFGRALSTHPVLFVEAEGLEDISSRAQGLLDEWPECERVEVSLDGNLLAIPQQRLFKVS